MKKKLLIAILAITASLCSTLGLAACKNGKENDKADSWGSVYTIEAAYAEAKELGYGGTLEEFLESIKGKDGTNGTNGTDGKDGKSAFQIWLDNGHIGSEADFLDWLKGTNGTDGTNGTNGVDGKDGKDGVDGKDGLNGTDGKNGTNGTNGVDGKDGADGVGVKNAYINENGELIIELTNDSTVNCGNISSYYESLQYVAIKDDKEIIGYSVMGIGSVTDIDLEIPSTYRGKPVKTISASAFSKCSNLTSVIIPDSVTSIGNRAFESCSGLTSITIPDSVTSIGNSAFESCSGLTSITIPDSVTSIGNSAFTSCSGLTSITIPDSVTSIGNSAVYCEASTVYCEATSKPSGWNSSWNPYGAPVVWDCNNNDVASDGYIYTVIDGVRFKLKDNKADVTKQPKTISNISIPKSINYKDNTYSVTSIGNRAFYGCSELTSITIPDSVTSIGNSAFTSCSGLTSITIPDSVTSIGGYAFQSCSGLTSITIPDSVTSIGDRAFIDCSGLTDIYYTGDIAGWCGIEGLGNLMSLTPKLYINGEEIKGELIIPDNVTSIGDGAFSYRSGLTSITIPNSVTSIGDSAFYNCNGLTDIYYTSDIAGWCGIEGLGNLMSSTRTLYINGKELTGELIIPDGVTSIGSCAFYGCTKLTSVIISDGVTSIGDNAFAHCSELTSITIPDSVTSIGNNVVYNCRKLINITFKGTKEQWLSITMPYGWNSNTAQFTITCTDGSLNKYGV